MPPPIQDPSTITGQFEKLVPGWVGAIQPYALELFGALALLDLAFFGWSLWREYRGDVTAAIMSTTNRLLLIALFLDVALSGPGRANKIINDFITVGKAAQLAASAVGQQAAQLGEQITSRNLNLQPTLKIRPGEPFYVSVQKSMVFPGPYEPIKLGGER